MIPRAINQIVDKAYSKNRIRQTMTARMIAGCNQYLSRVVKHITQASQSELLGNSNPIP